MAKFSVPSSPSRSILQVDTFHGVDFTQNPGNVDLSKSPNGQNMIRDVPGKVRKSMGYYQFGSFDGAINGYHQLLKDGKLEGLIHAGTGIYKIPSEEPSQETVLTPQKIYNEAANTRSKSWQVKDKLYLADGKELLVYDGDKIQPVQNIAYVPTLTIAKSPKGGGKEYEALNLLQPKFTELFAGTQEDKEFHLTFSGLDATTVKAFVKDSSGNWIEKSEGTDFSVDRESGIVTFNTAPGKSPVTGEDNVKITAARTVSGYADRINKCSIGILFGVNGAADRLFLSGNSDFINYDWYSGQYDPTYWPDTSYSVLGTGESAIMGYSIVNNYLATHKDNQETDRNIIIRQGNLVENNPAFPVINTLQGPGTIAVESFAYLENEPMFLTPLGVYAITPSDINGEKYSQNRSFFVNGKLNEEPLRERAFAFVYKDLYWLCLNNVAYILDGLQSLGRDRNAPYSTRQYACFYRTNLPAHTMWEQGGSLCFGTVDGRVCAFYKDVNALESYNDCGKPIHAVWETPDLSGKYFYKNKSFRYLAVQQTGAVATSVAMYGQKRGIWSLLKNENLKARFFSYSQLVYSKFSYSNDQPNKTLHTKIRMKKLDKARFRFENKELNEPFGLMSWAVEYVESGNFKG